MRRALSKCAKVGMAPFFSNWRPVEGVGGGPEPSKIPISAPFQNQHSQKELVSLPYLYVEPVHTDLSAKDRYGRWQFGLCF